MPFYSPSAPLAPRPRNRPRAAGRDGPRKAAGPCGAFPAPAAVQENATVETTGDTASARGQCRRDQAKQANCQAQQPEGYRHRYGTIYSLMLMIEPCGREVRSLPVQNYRWHLLTRPSFQQPLKSPLLDAEYGQANFTAADGPAQYEVRIQTTGLLIRKLGP